MKRFSQGEEEDYILEYFRDNQDGNFLDIGSYNPEIFSNVRALFEKGWTGICVEPSDDPFNVLKEAYKGTGVEVYNCAIGTETKIDEFFDSGGDALSSTDKDHVKKWTDDYDVTFTTTTKQFYTLEDLIAQSVYKSFNFVSIDVENDRLGIDILKQVQLYSVGMVCLECSYDLRSEVKEYMEGWKEVYSNAENILLCR
ncbi:hypothetical protein LCGC14_0388640 [marine sediment metagenome]|uniref:Methyltransferase FkbM domain-containing protein n=1 Tax=marine sediment metagenome TaxID=412755 RepID=A0A0F9TID8_9ZZZZ